MLLLLLFNKNHDESYLTKSRGQLWPLFFFRKNGETAMKLNQLIAKLETIRNNLRPVELNPEVLIDCDENGFYNLEKVRIIKDEDDTYINLKSSNEL